MSDIEQDKKDLLTNIHKRKIQLYDLLNHISQSDIEEMKHMGFRGISLEEAVGKATLMYMKQAKKDIEKMLRAFEDKYPLE